MMLFVVLRINTRHYLVAVAMRLLMLHVFGTIAAVVVGRKRGRRRRIQQSSIAPLVLEGVGAVRDDAYNFHGILLLLLLLLLLSLLLY